MQVETLNSLINCARVAGIFDCFSDVGRIYPSSRLCDSSWDDMTPESALTKYCFAYNSSRQIAFQAASSMAGSMPLMWDPRLSHKYNEPFTRYRTRAFQERIIARNNFSIASCKFILASSILYPQNPVHNTPHAP